MQALCPQRHWLELSPSLVPAVLSQSMATLLAWREGQMPQAAGCRLSAVGPLFEPAAVADLAGMPMSAWHNFAGHLVSKMVNAKAFSRSPDDQPARHAVQLMGMCHKPKGI